MSRRSPLILLVLAVAMALRCWAINWGAPFLYHPDEHLILQPALHIVRDGELNPHWFQYPSLLIYVEAAVVAVAQPFVAAPLTTDALINHIGPWDALPAQWPFVLGGRLVVAAWAVLGVWLLYVAGSTYSGTATGVGAAWLLVTAPLHNESSHFLTTDVPAATLLIGALALSLTAARRSTGRTLAAAGFVAGLAAGTKYTAGIALFVPLAVAASTPRRDGVRCVIIVLAAAAAGFLCACPFAVLDVSGFWAGLAQQRQNYLGDNVPGSDWRWYIKYLDETGLLRPVALVSGVGLLGMLLSGARSSAASATTHELPRRVHLALAIVPLAYFAFLSWYPYRAQRNLVILLPFLCLAGADVVWRVCRRVAHGRMAVATYALAIGVLAAPGLLACVRHDRQLAQPDTRSVALAWIDANVPAGSRVAREEYTPQVSSDRYRVTHEWSLAAHDYAWYLDEKVDYLVVSSSVYNRATRPPYVAGATGPAFYQFVFRHLPLAAEVTPAADRAGPVIRIYRVPHA